MPIVGKVELESDKDVAAGTEITLFELFPHWERAKEFVLESDVKWGETKLRITVDKLESFEAVASITKRKGEKTDLWMLLKMADFLKKIKAKEDIKKGEILSVTIETA